VRKFLLIGGYSHANPGDEAILKATAYRLNDLFPNSFFFIWASRQDFKLEFDRSIAYEVIRWNPFEALKQPNFFSRAGLKVYTDLYPVSASIFRLFTSTDRRFDRALEDADAVLYVGGGYLNSAYLLAEMEYFCRLAKNKNKPVYLLGQTLGPFTKKKHSDMARTIFSTARTIVLRDRYSAEETARWTNKVIVGVDDAVGFTPFLDAEDRAAIDRPLGPMDAGTLKIGLNLRTWEDSRAHYPEIARALAEFIASLRIPARIIFLPMETSIHCDDRTEAVEFAKHLPEGIDFRLLDKEISAEAKLHLAGMRHDGSFYRHAPS
jgi:polysaccharide pyruvyl transferase WcaK-like protein